VIRVLLADDEAMVRAGVRAILGSDPGLEVVAEASDGREAIDLALKHRPDVVLLDVRMPRLGGLETAKELARLGFGVAMLTTFNDDGYLEQALDGGARGFLLKSGDPRELIAGVHALASGGAYLAPKVAARMIARFRGGRVGEARARVASLTARERDVLALLGQGLSNAQIARRLDLVEGTVKGHVSAILTRLGAENRVQAAIVAHEAGL
jgi:DNA-binding NarL/FixJ family response regulator